MPPLPPQHSRHGGVNPNILPIGDDYNLRETHRGNELDRLEDLLEGAKVDGAKKGKNKNKSKQTNKTTDHDEDKKEKKPYKPVEIRYEGYALSRLNPPRGEKPTWTKVGKRLLLVDSDTLCAKAIQHQKSTGLDALAHYQRLSIDQQGIIVRLIAEKNLKEKDVHAEWVLYDVKKLEKDVQVSSWRIGRTIIALRVIIKKQDKTLSSFEKPNTAADYEFGEIIDLSVPLKVLEESKDGKDGKDGKDDTGKDDTDDTEDKKKTKKDNVISDLDDDILAGIIDDTPHANQFRQNHHAYQQRYLLDPFAGQGLQYQDEQHRQQYQQPQPQFPEFQPPQHYHQNDPHHGDPFANVPPGSFPVPFEHQQNPYDHILPYAPMALHTNPFQPKVPGVAEQWAMPPHINQPHRIPESPYGLPRTSTRERSQSRIQDELERQLEREREENERLRAASRNAQEREAKERRARSLSRQRRESDTRRKQQDEICRLRDEVASMKDKVHHWQVGSAGSSSALHTGSHQGREREEEGRVTRSLARRRRENEAYRKQQEDTRRLRNVAVSIKDKINHRQGSANNSSTTSGHDQDIWDDRSSTMPELDRQMLDGLNSSSGQDFSQKDTSPTSNTETAGTNVHLGPDLARRERVSAQLNPVGIEKDKQVETQSIEDLSITDDRQHDNSPRHQSIAQGEPTHSARVTFGHTIQGSGPNGANVAASDRSGQSSAQPDHSVQESYDSSFKSLRSAFGSRMTHTTALTTAPSSKPRQHPEGSDLASLYAQTLGLPANETRDYALAFVRCLLEGLGILDGQLTPFPDSRTVLPELFRSFAAMMSPAPEHEHYDAVKFVHRQRSLITDLLLDPAYESAVLSEADDTGFEHSTRDAVPASDVEQRTTEWLSSLEVAGPPNPDTESQATGRDISLIEDARRFLQSGLPWKWLLNKLTTYRCLSWQDGRLDDRVSESVMQLLAEDARPIKSVSCQMSWQPLKFLNEQYRANAIPKLHDVIAMTGWANKIQATTCLQYVRQVWPLYGMQVLEGIEAMIESPNAAIHRVIDDSIVLDIQFSDTGISVTVHGVAQIVAQVISQLAWLGAVARTAPSTDQNCYTSARMEVLPKIREVNQVRIHYDYDISTPPQGSNCWWSFGRYASIATGFPILRRDEDEDGMEATPNLMTVLGEADYATKFNGTFILKGFASMLVAVKRNVRSIIWHFVHNATGEHLPYSFTSPITGTSGLDDDCLATNRHFIGWVSAAEICSGECIHYPRLYAGELSSPVQSLNSCDVCLGAPFLRQLRYGECWPDLDLSGVLAPRRLMTYSDIFIEKATISAGKFLNVGATIGLGYHQQPLWRSSPGIYVKEVRNARTWPIVLYDTDDERAWLVDGATVLLQVVSSQLHDPEFLETHHMVEPLNLRFRDYHRRGGADSLAVLCDTENIQLELHREPLTAEIKRTWSDKGLFMGDQPEQTLRIWSFHDQVRETFHLLDQMRACQWQMAPGIKIKLTHLDRLQGWSFRDVIRENLHLEPKVVPLMTSAREWVQLAQHINAIALLGGKFGQLIGPGPGVHPCCGWTSVPTGMDLLTVGHALLKEIAEDHRADDFPAQLIPGFKWHQQNALFHGFCTPAKKSSIMQPPVKCNRIQRLLRSAKYVFGDVIKPDFKPTDFGDANTLQPAFIFGRGKGDQVPDWHLNDRTVQNGDPPRRIRSDMEEKKPIPLPMFTSLLPGETAFSDGFTNDSRSVITSASTQSKSGASSSATSISKRMKPGPRQQIEAKGTRTMHNFVEESMGLNQHADHPSASFSHLRPSDSYGEQSAGAERTDNGTALRPDFMPTEGKYSDERERRHIPLSPCRKNTAHDDLPGLDHVPKASPSSTVMLQHRPVRQVRHDVKGTSWNIAGSERSAASTNFKEHGSLRRRRKTSMSWDNLRQAYVDQK